MGNKLELKINEKPLTAEARARVHAAMTKALKAEVDKGGHGANPAAFFASGSVMGMDALQHEEEHR